MLQVLHVWGFIPHNIHRRPNTQRKNIYANQKFMFSSSNVYISIHFKIAKLIFTINKNIDVSKNNFKIFLLFSLFLFSKTKSECHALFRHEILGIENIVVST